jgi:hypothetical protein
VTPEVLCAVDQRLGPPVDSYINGAQTWFTDEPDLGGITLEWRLHPVANFVPVAGLAADDRWDALIAALAQPEADPTQIPLGEETRSLSELWDGLECFVAYDEDCEPSPLAHAAAERLGCAPTHVGLVDHDEIGDAWEQARGGISISDVLRNQLSS